jgi:flavin reductase (DIM6/NTAB) family NADH-FMN oxidoreductase RutF
MFYDAVSNDHGFPVDPFKALVAPRPIGWIASLSAAGVANLAPFSFFNAISERPHYVVFGADLRADTLRNVRETAECTINLATWDLREQMNATAAEVGPEVDEFELAGLAKASSRLVRAPRVAESPVAFECRLHSTVPLPDDSGATRYEAVVARVVGIHIDDRFIRDGRVDTAAMKPIARLGYSEYATVTEAWRMRRPG